MHAIFFFTVVALKEIKVPRIHFNKGCVWAHCIVENCFDILPCNILNLYKGFDECLSNLLQNAVYEINPPLHLEVGYFLLVCGYFQVHNYLNVACHAFR